MTKKLLITILVLIATLFFTSSVFANTDMQNGDRNIGSEVKDSFNKLEEGAQDLGDNVKGAITNAGNKMTDRNNDNNNDKNNGTNNNGYTATRTSATNNGILGMSTGTMWTWVILAIVAIAIISLVWIYGSQNKTNSNHNK